MKPQDQIDTDNVVTNSSNLPGLLNDFSIDAIIAIDSQRNVIAWNRTAAITYDRSKEQAPGQSIFKLIPGLEDDKDTMYAIEQAFKGYNSFVPASKLHRHRLHRVNHCSLHPALLFHS